MIESQVRALFTEIANGEPGASRVDTQLAHRRGRARLRRRRASLAGAPVLAVAVVAAVVVAGAPFRSGGNGVSHGTGPAAPRQFSPLVPYVSLGWMPAGDKVVEGGTSQGMMWLNTAPKLNSPPSREFSLGVYAAGKCHLTTARPGTHSAGGPLAGPTPSPGAKELKCSTPEGPPTMPITGRAPAVRGHRAFWGPFSLIWQYARDGWTEMSRPVHLVGSPMSAAEKRDAVTMADHVRYGAATPPLVFPLQLTHVPSRWQVSSVTYVPAAGVLAVSGYSLGSGPPNLGADGGLVYQAGLPYFLVQPISRRAPSCYVEPHYSTVTTINGYRVVLTNERFGHLERQDLCVRARGLSLYMSEYSAHPANSLAGLFGQHLRLLGRNPAHWTPNPIR